MTQFISIARLAFVLLVSITLTAKGHAAHSTGKFESSILDLKLVENRWDPKADQVHKGTIILVHGVKDYGDRYKGFADYANRLGYTVKILDLPGHGDSPREASSKPGPDGLILNMDAVAETITSQVAATRRENPRRPVFVIGYSMGGAIVSRAAELHQKEFEDGVVLISPALEPFNLQKILLPLLSGIGSVWPNAHIWGGLECSKFSNSPSVVKNLETSPRVFKGDYPIRTGTEIAHETYKINGNIEDFVSPVLIIHSAADQVTNPHGSQRTFDSISSPDKTLKIIPKELAVKHDLLHEPNGEGEEIQKLIMAWIKKRT